MDEQHDDKRHDDKDANNPRHDIKARLTRTPNIIMADTWATDHIQPEQPSTGIRPGPRRGP